MPQATTQIGFLLHVWLDFRSILNFRGVGFLKSFVERVEVDDSEVKVYYTISMLLYSVSEEAVEVLPFVRNG